MIFIHFLGYLFYFSIFPVLPIRLALDIKTLTLWLRLDVYVYLASYIADVPEYDRRGNGTRRNGKEQDRMQLDKVG